MARDLVLESVLQFFQLTETVIACIWMFTIGQGFPFKEWVKAFNSTTDLYQFPIDEEGLKNRDIPT